MTNLTARQLEVALALARGATQAEAAKQLGLSVDTIRFHLNAIKRKLGIASGRDLATALVEQNIATAEEILGAAL